jgi:quercetin dioxygenase-like cupin family protein
MSRLSVIVFSWLAFLGVQAAGAAATSAPPPEVRCIPAEKATDRKLGCFITASREIGKLPQSPLFWHIVEYPTQAAAEAGKGKLGTVVNSYGKWWVLAVADGAWNADGGKRVARVGPLPIDKADIGYTATYMEATFVKGMRSHVHKHAGPEAWYVLAGQQCLETPGHKQIVKTGESGIVPGGPPMMLSSFGPAERRALVLILHDSTQTSTMHDVDWKPEGLCAAADH